MTIIIHPALVALGLVAVVALAVLRARPTATASDAQAPAQPHRKTNVQRQKFQAIPTMTEPSFVNGRGYVMVKALGHPLVGVNGYMREHRKVLYDAIGDGTHACRWCGREVEWVTSQPQRRLVVDHVDGDKQNNTIDNLAPACIPCNSTRHAPLTPVDDADRQCKDCAQPMADPRGARCGACHRAFERERKRLSRARQRLARHSAS